MSTAAAAAYQTVIDEADQLESSASRRNVDRLRRELNRIEARDYHPSRERDQARRAVDRLAAIVEAADEPAR